jgi:hypothetical protein
MLGKLDTMQGLHVLQKNVGTFYQKVPTKAGRVIHYVLTKILSDITWITMRNSGQVL